VFCGWVGGGGGGGGVLRTLLCIFKRPFFAFALDLMLLDQFILGNVSKGVVCGFYLLLDPHACSSLALGHGSIEICPG